jgi:hypothetical protein
MSTRDKVEKSSVTEHLELLSNLLPDVSVIRIKPAQGSFERIDIIELKFAPSDALNTLHDLDQPTARVNSLIPKE